MTTKQFTDHTVTIRTDHAPESLGPDTTGVDLDATFEALDNAQADAIRAAFPGITVEFVGSLSDRIRVFAPDDPSEDGIRADVRDIMDRVFNDGKFYVMLNEASA